MSERIDWLTRFGNLPLRKWVDALSKRWYVVHAFSGYREAGYANAARAESYLVCAHLPRSLAKSLVPAEEVVEMTRWEEASAVSGSSFPGYVLVEMELDDEHLAPCEGDAAGDGLYWW